MTALMSTICHYCGGRATTEDHIVPRADLPKPMYTLPYWFRINNVVPACSTCNNIKGRLRSDCTCDQCEWAWNTAIGALLPSDYRPPHVIKVVRSPG